MLRGTTFSPLSQTFSHLLKSPPKASWLQKPALGEGLHQAVVGGAAKKLKLPY